MPRFTAHVQGLPRSTAHVQTSTAHVQDTPRSIGHIKDTLRYVAHLYNKQTVSQSFHKSGKCKGFLFKVLQKNFFLIYKKILNFSDFFV